MSLSRNLTGQKHFAAVIGALVTITAFLTPASAAAQVSKTRTGDGAVLSQTATKASTHVPESHPQTQEPLASGVSVIFSNFGSGTALYDAGTGWTEAGVEANDEAIAEAMSFTPDSNYLVVRIDAAFTWLQGTNGVKLVLAEDNAGVPGKIIYVTSFSNLPDFGTCCTVQTAKLSPSKPAM